ncbi:hypothetical protein CK203_102960 [Vitis vinifera]|uniref:Uncharacterized protein n=1 Tax=Vitis vinifera TaxID=29760 RepID=A0A438E6Y5_VITVI|nr:hypothetical protein CK203_102960 [Vitis vinifera]
MSCAICQSFEHLVEECPILPAAREMFGMPCGICQSFEHLVEECPIIPVAREIFGDYNTYNSNCRNHPNFFWEPQPRQYMQPAQAPHQALKLKQAIVNLTKVVEDCVAHQKSIIDQFKQDNAQVRQETDSQDKKMDEVQNDLSQKIDNLQDSISRLINLNTMQEKENSPSQPHQNQKGIHEMEAKESDKEVDLPTCKLEHKEESETEKEKREEIKGKKKGKSTKEDGYDVNESIASNSARFGVETKKLWPFEEDCVKLNGNVAAAPHFATESSASNGVQFGFETKKLWPFERIQFRIWLLHPYPPQSQASKPHFFAPLCLRPEEATPQLPRAIREPRAPWDHTHEASHSISDLLKPSKPIAPVEETMPSKETTKTEAKVLIQPTQKATTDASAPQDLTII